MSTATTVLMIMVMFSILLIMNIMIITYMKILLVGRIIGVPIKRRTCPLLVSFWLHLWGVLIIIATIIFITIIISTIIIITIITVVTIIIVNIIFCKVVKTSPWLGLAGSLGSCKSFLYLHHHCDDRYDDNDDGNDDENKPWGDKV